MTGGGSDWRLHYVSFGATPPDGNRVTVCHAYTCKKKTAYTFSKQGHRRDRGAHGQDQARRHPFEERRAVAYAIANIEMRVGKKLGINDRAGMQYAASGDPTPEDCVDEATNTTSYLLVTAGQRPDQASQRRASPCPRTICPRAWSRSTR